MAAMLDDLFAESIVHKPIPRLVRLRNAVASAVLSGESRWTGHVVLGVRLRAFSYWHAFNLDLINFAADTLLTKLPSVQIFTSLYLAARCCSVQYPQLATRCRGACAKRLARRFLQDEPFRLGQIKTYLDYRKDYAECLPEMLETGESVKLPWYLYQVHVLMRIKPRLTLSQAWDSPVPESQWNLLGHHAAAGAKIDILTPEDRKDMAETTKAA